MHELRYGSGKPGFQRRIEPTVLNPSKLDAATGALRLNLACGPLPLPEYVNVDARNLTDIDVVAGLLS